MIGWMPSTATRKPFQAPRTSATSDADADREQHACSGCSGCREPSMIVSATAPETAMIAPTDRSMPRVAMTSVMPSATSMSGALLRRMSISEP